MGAVYFYHLTRGPLEQTLPKLLGLSLQRGWRVEIRGRDAGAMDRLDAALWRGPEDEFLPHGRAGGPHDRLQPVLLTAGEPATNAPSCIMAIHGAEIAPEELLPLERGCILFDGTDDRAMQQARGQWKTYVDAGCSAQYWSEDSGRWEMKAER